MRIALKIIAFTLAFNVAIGILTLALPDFVTLGATNGLTYDSTMTDEMNSLGGQINPTGLLEDQNDGLYRLLDSINLGFISKFLSVAENLVFGFVNLLQSIFDAPMRAENAPLATFLFGDYFLYPGILRIIISIIYAITVISLWTGKDFDEG